MTADFMDALENQARFDDLGLDVRSQWVGKYKHDGKPYKRLQS